MQFLRLNQIVVVLIDLSERRINELICEWCTDAVSAEEARKELTELLTIQHLILIGVELLEVSV